MPQTDSLSCNITASFLDSGRVLANAANAAAIVGGVGCLTAGAVLGRIVLAASILLWFAECYYAVRVSIDSSLFRVLADDPDDGGRRLDMLFHRARRSINERSRGALALWRKQRVALALQLAALMAGIVLRVAGV